MFYPCMGFRSRFSLDPARVAELTDSYLLGCAVWRAFETLDLRYPTASPEPVDTPEVEKSWNLVSQYITLFIELLAEQTSVDYAIEVTESRVNAVISYLKSRLDPTWIFLPALVDILDIAEDISEETARGHYMRRVDR